MSGKRLRTGDRFVVLEGHQSEVVLDALLQRGHLLLAAGQLNLRLRMRALRFLQVGAAARLGRLVLGAFGLLLGQLRFQRIRLGLRLGQRGFDDPEPGLGLGEIPASRGFRPRTSLGPQAPILEIRLQVGEADVGVGRTRGRLPRRRARQLDVCLQLQQQGRPLATREAQPERVDLGLRLAFFGLKPGTTLLRNPACLVGALNLLGQPQDGRRQVFELSFLRSEFKAHLFHAQPRGLVQPGGLFCHAGGLRQPGASSLQVGAHRCAFAALDLGAPPPPLQAPPRPAPAPPKAALPLRPRRSPRLKL